LSASLGPIEQKEGGDHGQVHNLTLFRDTTLPGRAVNTRPLCLLALGKSASWTSRPCVLTIADGGGIRGLSELVVLEEIMNRIKHDLGLDGDPVPAQFFDLIKAHQQEGIIATPTAYLDHS